MNILNLASRFPLPIIRDFFLMNFRKFPSNNFDWISLLMHFALPFIFTLFCLTQENNFTVFFFWVEKNISSLLTVLAIVSASLVSTQSSILNIKEEENQNLKILQRNVYVQISYLLILGFLLILLLLGICLLKVNKFHNVIALKSFYFITVFSFAGFVLTFIECLKSIYIFFYKAQKWSK